MKTGSLKTTCFIRGRFLEFSLQKAYEPGCDLRNKDSCPMGICVICGKIEELSANCNNDPRATDKICSQIIMVIY
jgi:hypothetical protein